MALLGVPFHFFNGNRANREHGYLSTCLYHWPVMAAADPGTAAKEEYDFKARPPMTWHGLRKLQIFCGVEKGHWNWNVCIPTVICAALCSPSEVRWFKEFLLSNRQSPETSTLSLRGFRWMKSTLLNFPDQAGLCRDEWERKIDLGVANGGDRVWKTNIWLVLKAKLVFAPTLCLLRWPISIRCLINGKTITNQLDFSCVPHVCTDPRVPLNLKDLQKAEPGLERKIMQDPLIFFRHEKQISFQVLLILTTARVVTVAHAR